MLCQLANASVSGTAEVFAQAAAGLPEAKCCERLIRLPVACVAVARVQGLKSPSFIFRLTSGEPEVDASPVILGSILSYGGDTVVVGCGQSHDVMTRCALAQSVDSEFPKNLRGMPGVH